MRASKRYSGFVVLCEGKQDEVFARHFIRTYFNYPKKKPITVYKRYPGQGSGEQFVRERLAKEIKTYREKKNKLTIALIILTDADTLPYQTRLNQLQQALLDANITPIQPDERIAIFIPKRSIETWIYALQGQLVNEENKYPDLPEETACKPFVQKLAEDCREGKTLPEDAPESLRFACQELARIS